MTFIQWELNKHNFTDTSKSGNTAERTRRKRQMAWIVDNIWVLGTRKETYEMNAWCSSNVDIYVI